MSPDFSRHCARSAEETLSGPDEIRPALPRLGAGGQLCAAHAGQATVTQPSEETDRALYGQFFRPADLQALDALLATTAGATSLAAEIEVARVFLRRVLEVLEEMAA